MALHSIYGKTESDERLVPPSGTSVLYAFPTSRAQADGIIPRGVISPYCRGLKQNRQRLFLTKESDDFFHFCPLDSPKRGLVIALKK